MSVIEKSFVPPPDEMRMGIPPIRHLLLFFSPVIFIATLLLLWQAAVVVLRIPAYVLPSPADIYQVLTTQFSPLMTYAGMTAHSTLIGFGCGVAIGLLLGGVLGSSRVLHDMSYPTIIAFHAIPNVALIPLFMIWFGMGSHISVIAATLSCFFPVTVIVSTAVAASSPELDDVLRSLGASKRDLLFKVAFPRAMPQFFGSTRLAISSAFISSVVSEIYAGSPGIGRVMVLAANDLNGPLAFAGLTILGAMGVTLYIASTLVEKQLTGWAYRR